jgi:dissimilatory sulfite reductase (desulfoviridin) alpha/beta subunit
MESRRMVGAAIMGGGVMDKLGDMLSKAKNIYDKAKPVISAVKDVAKAIPHDKSRQVGDVLGKLGFGGARLNERLM